MAGQAADQAIIVPFIRFDFAGDLSEFADMFKELKDAQKVEVKDNMMEFILFESGLIKREDMTIFNDAYWGKDARDESIPGFKKIDDEKVGEADKVGDAKVGEADKINLAQTECWHGGYRGGWMNWWAPRFNNCWGGWGGCGNWGGCGGHHHHHGGCHHHHC